MFFHPSLRTRFLNFQAACPALWGILIFGIAGCRHHCGYVEQHARLVRIPEKDKTEYATDRAEILVHQPVSVLQPILRFRVSRVGHGEQAFRQEIWGREQYAPMLWYHPPLKIFLWILFWRPFWRPFEDPHYHNGENWDLLDYLRDVFAYYNIFEAIPDAARRPGPEKLIRTRVIYLRGENLTAPVSGGRVAVRWTNRQLAELYTDEDGEAALDVNKLLLPEMAGAELKLTLIYYISETQQVPAEVVIAPEVVTELLKRRAPK